MGSYTLSAIVTKVTGQTSLEYLKPRLFEPLGIENPEWATSREGNSLGGNGLKLRTEDIAKFGQLYLQKGQVEWQAIDSGKMGRTGHEQAGAQRPGIPRQDRHRLATRLRLSILALHRMMPFAATAPAVNSAS